MGITFREYTESDQALVQEFIFKLQDYIVNTDPIHRIKNNPGLSELGLKNVLEKIQTNQGKVYFALSGQNVIGYIFGFVCDKQSDKDQLEVEPSQVGQIEDIFIDESFRGQGVGKALMAKMEDYLHSQNCDSIWLEVFAPNQNAHSAYIKLGYQDRQIGMLKKLK